MEKKLTELKHKLQEVYDLKMAIALLGWDQNTYMPPGGASARASQLATLGRLAHEAFIDPAVGKLLADLRPYAEALPYDSDDASLIRVTQRNYEKSTKIPARLVSEFAAHNAAAYQLWTKARPDNDFAAIQPYLEKTIDYSRQIAECFPGYDHIADPLIDFADEGMKTESIRALFAELRQQLIPLVQAITAHEPADNSCLRQSFPEAKQLSFGLEIIKQFGYDLDRGRQDKTLHPFMIKFGLGDVRITTRVKEKDLNDALFSTLHEAGHAMYEQGIAPNLEGTPLADGTSAGVHESQSRLWENLVGRSHSFWKYYYPKLQKQFPNQLDKVNLDTFYRAINKVERSLIRTDADEVTYNLHVLIRFDLELQLLEGSLAVKDLPEAWHARHLSDLGVQATNDTDGVLQDVHWFGDMVGGQFQGYTLGNIMSALFYETALKARPDIPAQIERGDFSELHGWLREYIYKHGKKFTANELVERVTGSTLTIEPYMRYLHKKFGELYPL